MVGSMHAPSTQRFQIFLSVGSIPVHPKTKDEYGIYLSLLINFYMSIIDRVLLINVSSKSEAIIQTFVYNLVYHQVRMLLSENAHRVISLMRGLHA